MFNPGQTVYHKTGKHSGKVQECDGHTTYILQANGAEADFPTRDLTLSPPAGKNPVSNEPANMTRTLTMADITPDHEKILKIIPQRTLQAVAALWEKQPRSGRFSGLNTAQKLNYITQVTAIPYRTMKQYGDQPGNLGLMMARGLTITAQLP